MFDEAFRVRFSGWAQPLIRPLTRLGVAPNHITVVTFLMALGAALLIARGRPIAGLGIWLISRLGDGIDGALARGTQQSSAFGGYLDITLDMAGYSALVLGFAAAHPALWWSWLAVLTGYVVVITTTLALSDAGRHAGRTISGTNRTFQFTAGLTEAGETSVMYALWALFPQHLPWLVWLWVAALAITGVQRTYLAWRLLR